MKARLQSDLKEALRAKDKLKLSTIRSILSAIQYQEMQNETSELSEQDYIAILKSELKKRKEELDFAEKASRVELQSNLSIEIGIIDDYLPKQLSEEQLLTIIKNIISDQETPNLGLVMKFLKSQYDGQYDGKLASNLAKSLLG